MRPGPSGRACYARGVLSVLLLVAAQSSLPPVNVSRGTLVVHLVDPDGGLVLEDFVVHATRLLPGSRSEIGPGYQASLVPEDGTATFRAVSPGRYRVGAVHPAGDRTGSVEVEVSTRARLSCELRLATPPPSRCLYVVIESNWPIDGLQLFARAGSGEAIPLVLDPGARDRYVARGVPPGRYTVSVVDSRYRATSVEGVLTGEVARLTLEGSATVALRFRAEPGGAPLCPRALEVRFDPFSSPAMRMRGDAALVELEDVPPGALVAVAHFEGRPPVRFALEGLRHGERRELEVAVPVGKALSGRVLDEVGEPVADALVVTHTSLVVDAGAWWTWVEPGATHELHPQQFSREDERMRRVARTDSLGRYTFVGLATGAHLIIAYGTPFTRKEIQAHVEATRGESSALDLVLDGNASAEFAVRLPEDLDPRELVFELRIGRGSWLTPLDAGASPPLDERGRLVLRGLPGRGCTLLVSRWIERVDLRGAMWKEQVILARVPFRPKGGTPTPMTLDLRLQ